MSKDNDRTLENSPKINQKAEKPKFQIPKKTLSEYFNIEDLKQIQRNALSKKEIDYAEAVELRIKEIIDAEFGILGDRFFKSLDAHEANLYEKHNKNVRANFIRRMVKNHGIFETINRLVSNKKKLSQGFSEMVDSGDGENTLEKIVLDYPDLFPEETVTAAKEKLKSI